MHNTDPTTVINNLIYDAWQGEMQLATKTKCSRQRLRRATVSVAVIGPPCLERRQVNISYEN